MSAKTKGTRKRLDALVLERGLAGSLHQAAAMILAGEVWVNGAPSLKGGMTVLTSDRIEIVGVAPKYASRGGLKLEGALEEFAVTVAGKTCLDVGASTGGFTDCLLAHGARTVYAADVTPSQMAWRLQQDPRVVQMKVNARHLRREQFSQPVDLVTVDVSFISVAKVLPAIIAATGPVTEYLILIKPQFELLRHEVSEGGIVHDAALHLQAVGQVRAAALHEGLVVHDVLPSRLTGAEGNQEFFLHAWKRPRESSATV